MVLLAFPALAQKPGARPVPKYDVLFVVDISLSMSREKEAVAQTVFNLIRTSLADKMATGDRLGVWTFNERVYTTRFPPETWTPERGEIIADRIARYLRSLRYERQSQPGKAIAEILKTARTSKSLTVFLLSNGDAPVVGTPFDRSLNVLYREYRTDLQRVGKPFVTQFTIDNGQFVTWDVSADLGQSKEAENTSPSKSIAVLPTNSPPAQSTVVTELPEPVKSTTDQTPLQAAAPATLPPIESKPAPPPAPQRDEPKTEITAAKSEPEKIPLPATPVATPADTKPSPLPVPKDDRTEPTTVAPAPATKEIPSSETITKSNPPSQAGETLVASEPAPNVRPSPPSQPNLAQNEIRPARAENPKVEETPPQTAAALPPDVAPSGGKYAVWGACLLIMAVGLLYWSARSRRQRRRPSLIFRSLNQRGR